MGLRDEITDYLNELEVDLADDAGMRPSVIWKGLTFPCVYTTERRGTEIVRGGHAETIQLTVKIRRELMRPPITVDSIVDIIIIGIGADSDTANPKSRDSVKRNEKKYRVISANQDPTGAYWELELGSMNR